MSRPLFLRIVNEVEQYDPYFIQRTDVVGVLSLSSLQKITAAYRILAYGTPTDSVDEYIRIGESTTIESLRRFVKAVIAMFGDHYLRHQTISILLDCYKRGNNVAFLACYGVLIACIESGKIVLPRGKVCILVIVINQQSF